jgi:hypothetical protein
MKKFAALVLVMIVLGGLALVARPPSLADLFLDKDGKELLKLAQSFLESIQFKDFETASKFHNLVDQKKADIPLLIERLFQIKPEFLNIRDLKVTKVDIDSTGRRARTFFNANVEMLNSLREKKDGDVERDEKDTEGILYWQKEDDGRWVLKLESSLR